MPVPDSIIIKDLTLRCIIGIYDYERKNKQDVLINMTLYSDLHPAGQSDNISDTINYKSLTKEIIASVEKSSFFLLEALASHISSICLKKSRINGCKIRVDKPGALRYSKSVGVEIERWKE